MDAYVDTKDQFDKYFEMSNIFTIFFNNWIILDLNSGMGERWCEWGRGGKKKKGKGKKREKKEQRKERGHQVSLHHVNG